VFQATDATDEDLQKISAALGTIKGVIHVGVLASEKNCVFVLATADSVVTVERAIRYLDLAGYAVKEADGEVYKRVETAIGSAAIDVPASIAGSCGTATPPTTTQSGAPLTSLAESLAPFREAFNASKGRYRFVALLSPT